MSMYDDLEPVREPPNNMHAEQSVIGGLVISDGECWADVRALVGSDDFYRREHRVMFAAIEAICAAAGRPDVVTIVDWLDRNGKVDEAGGFEYVKMTILDTPSAANVLAYAKIVRDASTKRRLIAFAADQQAAGFAHDGSDAKTLLEDAQAKLGALAERGAPAVGGWVSVKDSIASVLDIIDKRFATGNGMVGVSTGWADLDRMLRGLEPGTLTIVAARPAMGKTSLTMQLAEHVATLGVGPAAVFSLEMLRESLEIRMLANVGRVDHDRLRTGSLSNDEWIRTTDASSLIKQMDLHIEDQSEVTVTDIAARAKRLKKDRGGLALVVIDYLQLIAFGKGRVENQNLGIGNITRKLKGMAKDLEVPVVLLSQLNRECEKRTNKRPQLSDLRDSGSIEQDADVVAFIYRDEVYDKDSADKGLAEIIIAKNRAGETGVAKMVFSGRHCRFDDLVQDNNATEWRG